MDPFGLHEHDERHAEVERQIRHATLSAPFVAMVVRAYERIRDYRVSGVTDVEVDTDAAGQATAGGSS